MTNDSTAHDSSTYSASWRYRWIASGAALKRWLSHATEPHILFPSIAVFGLALIWGTTLNLVKVERAAAEKAAGESGRALAEIYEGQVVRAVREIDQTLKVVNYAYALRGRQDALPDLKARALLPPDLLFVVSIADSKGRILASSRPLKTPVVADEDDFESWIRTDALSVGKPRLDASSGKWILQFGRRLDSTDGKFSGIVLISVDAAYFTSSYETAELGEHGVLGLLGIDGVFRVRRTGDAVFAGDAVDYAAVLTPTADLEGNAAVWTNSWDGVRRYTIARQLRSFPLAVVLGLSEDEQLSAARRNMRVYVWRASAASLLLILVLWVLGRMSRQLALGRMRAVDEHIAHARRVEHLAYHDSLTALPNRSLFSKLLGQSISQAHRYNRKLAVLFLDLDLFKNINDTLGHEAGDRLLREVATRLQTCVRESDTVARMGGDEFVALLPEVADEEDAATVARKILAAVARPFILLGHEFRVTASIGISTYPQDGADEQTLTKNADIAMYKAKEEGKNKFQFYSEELNTKTLERLTLESGLRHALERKEFELYYQAKRDTQSGRITGMEALLRWQHPDLGMLAPMQFIPVAEETGLILPIGRWVLREACLQNVAWQKLGLPHLSMAVNLTTRQFCDEHLLADLTAIIAETGMDAHLLEIEITESLLLRNVENTMRIFTGLKAMGIRIAVDDFGIGYTSLSTLKQFPVDTVKIDRSFIRDVASDTENKDLTDAIIAMGRTLSLTVVAQGVETKAQADFLRVHACDEFQGFYVNRPVPADAVTELLRASREAQSTSSRDARIEFSNT